MNETYEDYRSKERALSFEEMNRIHAEILQLIAGDEDALELYGEAVDAAVNYAHIRAEWDLWDRNTKIENDRHRTALHDKFIVTMNQLARYLVLQGKEANWREELGDEKEDRWNRKRIGDFGCYLAFINGINAR